MLVVTIPGTCSFVPVKRDSDALHIVVSGVVLNLTVSAGGGSVFDRFFLLGVSSSVGGTCFHFWS